MGASVIRVMRAGEFGVVFNTPTEAANDPKNALRFMRISWQRNSMRKTYSSSYSHRKNRLFRTIRPISRMRLRCRIWQMEEPHDSVSADSLAEFKLPAVWSLDLQGGNLI